MFRIAARDFDFTSVAPLLLEDVQGLVPLIRTCEPDPLLPEFTMYVESVRVACEDGNFSEALQCAQIGSTIVQQVCGCTVHEYLQYENN